MVISYRIWREKYGSDPSVVGANYQINGHPFTVIGVAAPGFYGAKLAGWGMPDFWLPLTTEPLIDGATARLKRPNGNFLDVIGRARPGVQPKPLEAKVKVELHAWLASHVPEMEPGEKQLWGQQTLHLIPGGAGVASMRDQYEDGLKLLLIAAGCVLLVACANLANLMLARGLKERGQTSVRVALGASRGRLVRKVLVGSMLLAIIGGALGIGVAYAGTKLIVRAPRLSDRRAQQLRSYRRSAILADPAVHARRIDADRSDIWNRSGVDDFACRPGGCSSCGGTFRRRRAIPTAKVAGDFASRGVAGVAVGGRDAGREPSKPGAPEFRI